VGAAVQWVVLATQHLLSTGRVHLLVHHLDDDASLVQTTAACTAVHLDVLASRHPAEVPAVELSRGRVRDFERECCESRHDPNHRSRMRDVQASSLCWRSQRCCARYKYNDAANYKYNDAAKMMSRLILSDAVVNFSSKAASPITCESRQPTSASHPRHTARASTTAHTPLLSPPAVVPTLPDAG